MNEVVTIVVNNLLEIVFAVLGASFTGKASATPAVKTYTVKAGDSLWRIAAQQLGNGARYKEIKTLNGLKNDTIHAGQVLKLPN